MVNEEVCAGRMPENMCAIVSPFMDSGYIASIHVCFFWVLCTMEWQKTLERDQSWNASIFLISRIVLVEIFQ